MFISATHCRCDQAPTRSDGLFFLVFGANFDRASFTFFVSPVFFLVISDCFYFNAVFRFIKSLEPSSQRPTFLHLSFFSMGL